MAFQRTLVTAALPYANGHVHIGHLAGAYLPADIYVKYLRLRAEEVLYVCGSDEHGVPITLSALQEKTSPRQVIDFYHPHNEKAFAACRVDFDIYGRTSWPLHVDSTHEFFLKLHRGGHLEKRTIEQFYSEKSRLFLPDRYVLGECPHCGNSAARGDECNRCNRPYEVTDLKNPRCNLPDDESVPVRRQTAHWFLKLDNFREPLKNWLATRQDWRPAVLGTAHNWIETLRPRCITRDTDWGVPIPLDDPEAQAKRIYVWFDAPIGYITNTRQWARQQNAPQLWEKYWKDPQCRLIHFIGKDNVPFHCVIFPAMLLGQGDYLLPDNVPANEFLNLAGAKFSKSELRRAGLINDHDPDYPGCSPYDIGPFARDFGSDRLRFYICAIMPELKDSEFSWKDFQARCNNELANKLGNFVHRCLVFTAKYFQGRVPRQGILQEADHRMLAEIEATKEDLAKFLASFRFRQAVERLIALSQSANVYFDQTEPFRTRKSDLERCATTLHVCCQVTAALCRLSWPILPQAAEKLAAILGLDVGRGTWDRITAVALPEGAPLGRPEVLFPRIESEVLPPEGSGA